MGSLFGSDKKKEQKQQQQQQQQKSQFPSQKKELTQGEKMRIRLQQQRDQLRDKQKQIEIQVEAYEKEIKDLIVKNKKDQAKHVVQRKMLYDKFLDNILQKQQVIAQSIVSVDQLQSDKEMADLVQQTNNVMKDIQESMNMDALQDAMLDMQQVKQNQDQMNGLYKQYQVDDDAEIDEIYSKYAQQEAKSVFKDSSKQQQQFVPLQPQTQQQHQPQQQQEKNEYQDRLEMLE